MPALFVGTEVLSAIFVNSSSRTVRASSQTSGVVILDEEGQAYPVSEEGNKILDEESTSSTYGIATPLSFVSRSCTYVVIQAKSTNIGPIRISGLDVAVDNGVQLTASQQLPKLDNVNLNQIYIFGYAGDGVDFTYGTTYDIAQDNLVNTDFRDIANTDGRIIENT